MRRFLLIFMAFILSAPTLWAEKLDKATKDDGSKYKIFVQDVRIVGLDEKYASIYSSIIAESIQNMDMFEVVTNQDLQEMIGYEAMKDLMACDDVSCMADIGGVAVADFMLTSNISKFDDNIAIALNISNVETMQKIKTNTEMVIGNSIYKVNQLLPYQTKLLFSQYLPKKRNQQLKEAIVAIKDGNEAKYQEFQQAEEKQLKEQKKQKVKAEKQAQHAAKEALIDPAIKPLRAVAIATGIIGGVAILTGGIMSGCAVSSKNHFVEAEAWEYSFDGGAYAFKQEVENNNKLAVGGTVTWALGSALAVTSLVFGIDFAIKNKKPKVVAIPAFSADGAQLTLSYRW